MDELLWHFVWTFFFQVLVSAVNQDSEHTSLLNSPSSSGETTPIQRPLMVSEHLFKLPKEAGLEIEKILRSPFGDQLEKYSRQVQIFSRYFV